MKLTKTTKGLVWILSGLIILILTATIQVITNFVLSDNGQNNLIENVIQITTWILGTLGVLLLFAGPIVGIIILTKKEIPPQK